MMIFTDNLKNYLNGFDYVDLFCGIGGFHYAFNSFGARCVFSSDWDKKAQDVYEINFGIRPYGDITRINEADIPRHDILCGGFPCQAFSISGKQKGFDDARGTLFFDVARIVKYHKPKILLLENVENFERHDNGNTIKVVNNILSDLGYKVFYSVLNASKYGIPQSRKRIYILAFRNDLNVTKFNFPKPLNIPIKLSDILLPDDSIKDYLVKDKVFNFKNSIDVKPNLYGHYPLHPIRIGTVNKGGQGDRIYHPFGHAITLSAYGGGTGAKTGLYLINNKVRKLAPRECARLMGFPDNFIIHKTNGESYKQFGNAVIIDILQYIIIEIINQKII